MCLVSVVNAAGAPRGSFTAAQYDAAKAKAQELGKPIAVVTTTIKSSCPKCVAGNEAVFKQMKDDYVLVIVDDANKEKLPKNIEQTTFAIYKSKGNVIPIVAVLSQTDDRLLGGLCYKQISDGKKAFTTLDKEVADAIAKAPAPKAAAAAPADAKPKPAAPAESGTGGTGGTGGMREWVNSEGKSIKAEAISRSVNSVSLKLENGKLVDYPLEKLSDESQKVLEEIFGDE